MALGPVDVVIIGFPGNKFTGRIVPAIRDLVKSGTVRVLDLLFVIKDVDGVTTTIDSRSRPGHWAGVSGDRRVQPGALGQEDAEEVTDDLEPNSSALLIAFENAGRGVRRRVPDADGVVIDRFASLPRSSRPSLPWLSSPPLSRPREV